MAEITTIDSNNNDEDRLELRDEIRRQPEMTGQQIREAYRMVEGRGFPDDFIRTRIDRGDTLEKIRMAVFDKLAERSQRTAINPANGDGFSNPDFLSQAIEGALYSRMSGKPPEGAATEWRGRSILDMGAALLEARGERPNWKRRDQLATQIMMRGGMHTTSDFPQLLMSSGNRVLLDAYKAAECPLKLLAANRDAPDFRALSVLKASEAPGLLEVPESGEVKYGTRFEAKESFRLKTFARMFGLSRQAIVNDDLFALSQPIAAFGRAAAETEANEIVALFAANSGDGVTMEDGSPLYSTGRTNKAASGGALSVATLSAARKALRDMKGLDGSTPISVTPRHLVVGSAKETEAEQVLAQLAAAQTSNVNPFSNKLTLHVEPRLAGNSWRLFADPSEISTLSIAHLNGNSGPIMETKDGWDTLGTEFRCVLDFGCGVTEYRGTYLNSGN